MADIKTETRVLYWRKSDWGVIQGPYSEGMMRAEIAKGLPKGVSFQKVTRVETVITEEVPND